MGSRLYQEPTEAEPGRSNGGGGGAGGGSVRRTQVRSPAAAAKETPPPPEKTAVEEGDGEGSQNSEGPSEISLGIKKIEFKYVECTM
ncbi:Hypothetical predicted protein [Podarcis lilfordi]|uniref:Uncharacterized protein n=1 Tax=Podarcis lilfordi TaxID=74358 RepID=A0AA35P1I3_9SAUR|nr:Hypothetical predicted protein [Podarcis lilfordi]